MLKISRTFVQNLYDIDCAGSFPNQLSELKGNYDY